MSDVDGSAGRASTRRLGWERHTQVFTTVNYQVALPTW